MDWSKLDLPTIAILIVGFVAIELARNYREKKAEAKAAPTIPVEVFGKIMAAAVTEALKPFSEVVDNNTEALNEMRIALAKLSGKIDNVLGNTNLLLQQRYPGGDGDCSDTG